MNKEVTIIEVDVASSATAKTVETTERISKLEAAMKSLLKTIHTLEAMTEVGFTIDIIDHMTKRVDTLLGKTKALVKITVAMQESLNGLTKAEKEMYFAMRGGKAAMDSLLSVGLAGALEAAIKLGLSNPTTGGFSTMTIPVALTSGGTAAAADRVDSMSVTVLRALHTITDDAGKSISKSLLSSYITDLGKKSTGTASGAAAQPYNTMPAKVAGSMVIAASLLDTIGDYAHAVESTAVESTDFKERAAYEKSAA